MVAIILLRSFRIIEYNVFTFICNIIEDFNMNLVSQNIVKPALQAHQSPVSFQGSVNPETIGKVADAAKDIFTNATKSPNSNAIKSGIKAVMTLLENFFAKNAEKIKAFIDNGAKNGSNKFVRFLAVTAGLVMSILSVVGATTIFKDNVKSDDAEKPVAETVVAEEPPVQPPKE